MNTKTPPAISEPKLPDSIQPFGWIKSSLLFLVPSLVMFVSFHSGISWFKQIGLSSYQAFITASTLPMAMLLSAAAAALIIEQKIRTWSEFRQALKTRMRFPKLTLKAILQGAGLYILLIPVGLASGYLNRSLIQTGVIPLPTTMPLLLDPQASINPAALSQFVGGSLIGNWEVVLLFTVQIFFNIAGEELWWRGFVLPRQEIAFGNQAWLVHGLMWWIFHSFKWWDMLTVLPLVLLISYAAQRTKNNWIPSLAHLLANSALGLILLAGVLGI